MRAKRVFSIRRAALKVHHVVFIVSAFVWLGLQTSAAAETHLYVSAYGSDDNSGTQAAPFRTVQRAADGVTPGSTVHVAAGVYNEQLVIDRSGTASEPITFVSDRKWGANIHFDDGDPYGAIVMVEGDHVDIRGFDVNGDTQVGIYMQGSYGSIVGNKVHGTSKNVDYNNGGSGIDGAGANYDNHDG